MTTTRRVLTLAVASTLAVGALAGCGSDDSGDGASGTTTAASTAPATPEPTATAPATTAPTTTAPEPAAAGPGDATTGAQVFVASCQACHADGGQRAAYGPKLAGNGLSEATIRTTVQNGRGQMPAGLVEGQELADVAAYVATIQ